MPIYNPVYSLVCELFCWACEQVVLESNSTRLSTLFITCSRKYVMDSSYVVCKL